MCPQTVYELQLEVTAADWPALETLLEELGAQAITQAGGDSAVFAEPGLDNAGQWGRFTVTALFDAASEIDGIAAALSAELGDLNIATRAIEDQDWAESWKAEWQPQFFDGGLCVCPSWCEPPAAARHVVRLDPGQAFGTGTHATTALCLDWLARAGALSAQYVIDYGCGSGILALAAAKLGARSVAAVDIDADALRVARENVRLNHLDEVITVSTPAVLVGAQAGSLVANILLEPLLALEHEFANLLAPGGRIALAGVLADQVGQVETAYTRHFQLEPAVVRGEWALLGGRLR